MTDTMIDLVMRVSAVLLVATLILPLLRGRSASLCALAWTAALAGALALPLVALSAPPLELEVLPPPADASTLASRTIAPIATPDAPGESAPAAPTFATGNLPESTALTPGSTSQVTAAITTASSGRAWLPSLLLGAWLVGTLLLVFRLLLSHARLAGLVHRATHEGPEWRATVDAVRTELGIRRAVDVRSTSEIDVPAVAGVFTPVLLLPSSAAWTSGERRDVVLHELAHVARWDALGQLVGQLACALHWFNPLSWHAAREASALREQACDNVVLNSGTRPSAYAERLLTFSRSPMIAELESVALAMARPARIHGRVLRILDPRARRTSLSARFATAFLALTMAVVALLAIVEPVAASPTGPAFVGSASTALAPVAPQQKPSAICRRGVESNSIHRNSDDGNETWRLTAKGPGCEVTIRIDGEARFNDAFTDVVRISGGGTFELDVREEGVRRELRLRDEDGRITRSWRVDGREQPYDAAAARWFGEMLIAIDRQTAFAVDVRLPILLQRGGVGTVLDETRQMPSDYARSAYYTALSKSRRLTPPELSRLLSQEADVSTSDYYASELLKGVARQGLSDPTVRDDVMRLISRMESDFHKSESIKATVVAGRPTNAEVDLLFKVVGTMESDYHKAETVKLLTETADLTTEQLGVVLATVGGMKSDFHINEMLASLVRRGTLDAPRRRVYLNAVRSMESDFHVGEALKGLLANGAPGTEEMDLLLAAITDVKSDHHKGEVMTRLLLVRTLREGDLLLAERAARTIESDYTQAEVLRRIGGHAAATAAVREAVYDAAGALSSHYRDEVRRSVGR